MLSSEEVIVPIKITEMYCGVPENRLSITIIETICANGIVLPPLIILFEKMIIVSCFEGLSGHLIGLEVITVSELGYTNEGICMTWLRHFIKHTNQGPNKPWIILFVNGHLSHELEEFVITFKANKIWLIKFPSH